jgi:hypothetical protein
MLFRLSSSSERRHRRNLRRVPRDFSPHQMRDIGLAPWPEPPQLSPHFFW